MIQQVHFWVFIKKKKKMKTLTEEDREDRRGPRSLQLVTAAEIRRPRRRPPVNK